MLVLQLLKLNANNSPQLRTTSLRTPSFLLLPNFLEKSRNFATSWLSAPSRSPCAPTPTTLMNGRFSLLFPSSVVQLFLGQERLLRMKIICFATTTLLSKSLCPTSTWTKTIRSCVKQSSTPFNKPDLLPLMQSNSLLSPPLSL